MTNERVSFSFGGCAWLMAYHMGVGRELQARFDTSSFTFLGASSGSLAATLMASGAGMDGGLELACELARETRTKRFLSPVGRMTSYVRRGMSQYLPADAHRRVEGRLIISVTSLPRLRNWRLPDRPLANNDELVNLLLGSCYIPVYYERPVFVRGRPVVDGGLTDNFPRLDEETVVVSPYPRQSTVAHIFPKIQPRFRHAVFPDAGVMARLYDQGRSDCDDFIARTGFALTTQAARSLPTAGDASTARSLGMQIVT